VIHGPRTTPPGSLLSSLESWADLLERGGAGWLLFSKNAPPILRDAAAVVKAAEAYLDEMDAPARPRITQRYAELRKALGR